MSTTEILRVERLTPTVGAAVLDVDCERLLRDDALPSAALEALEQNGVLVFAGLHVDDETQIAFCRRMGELSQEMIEISTRPENPISEYLKATAEWHIDGTTRGEAPERASFLSAKVVPPTGGETQFASSYAAYDQISDEERERFATLRVVHSFVVTQLQHTPNPTPEQLAEWELRGRWEHPLVWSHQSGRRSLVIGVSAEYIVGMDPEESKALLDDLLARATVPELVYTHRWAPGDTVMWDNRMMHRVLPFDREAGRELHRTTLKGSETIK